MRLAISKHNLFSADIYCADSRSAKRVLKEQPVSILSIDYELVGRESGEQLIYWAQDHRVLPQYVVVTERDRSHREKLSLALQLAGFRTADKTTYIRH